MPRIRTVKPEFFTSPDTEAASMEARLLFIAMWCWADDYGIGELNLLGLRAFAFPEDDPYLSNDIQSLCKEVQSAYNVKFYKVGRRSYFQILTWDEHQKTQRRAKDKNPHYDDENAQVDTRFHDMQGSSLRTLGDSSKEREREREREREKEGTATRSESVPDSFDDFWEVYPLKRDKRSARKAYAKAVKEVGPEVLIEGARRYRDDPGRKPDFTKHPTTWLNKGSWENEPSRPAGASWLSVVDGGFIDGEIVKEIE